MKTNTAINIIMADDHEIFRDGFAVMFRRSTDIKINCRSKEWKAIGYTGRKTQSGYCTH